jgi:hypothetical protein
MFFSGRPGAVIVSFGLAYLFALVMTLRGLLAQKSRDLTMQGASVPLHIVHGFVSIRFYIELHQHARRVGYPPGFSALFVGAGIRGCVVSISPSRYLPDAWN